MDNSEEKAERTITVEWPGWWATWTVANIQISATALQGRGVDVPITAISKRTGEKHIGTLKRLRLMPIVMLNACPGDEILLRASGRGAEEALEMFLSTVEEELQKIRDYRRTLSEGTDA